MEGKRYKKDDKENNLKRIVLFFILIIFIAIAIFSGIKIFIWTKENNENKETLENISKTVVIDEDEKDADKYSIDFQQLEELNSDTVAWIKVNGTNIEYPVVKTKNNAYYMNHNFEKKYNSAGWVFVDYRNTLDGSDKNIIIYAHNRKDGSMFSTLKNVLNKDWQEDENNFIIPFITKKEKSQYQVFSVYRIEEEDYYLKTNFKNSEEFKRFIDTVKRRSVKDFKIEVSEDDQILTLSTCDDNNRFRIVVHAKKYS